jgi:hypothetical protein
MTPDSPKQQVFGPDKRNGKWYFYTYSDGQQVEWGPYGSEAFAIGARNAIERRLLSTSAPPDRNSNKA